MKCKLCLEEKELIKKSHIIPDFMYGGIFGEKHDIYKVDLVNNNKSHKAYSGEYEGGLLCANCDGVIIGQLENYAKKVFFGGKLSKGENISFYKEKQNDLLLNCVSGIDYKQFKLFLLSILWRSGISQRPFFSNVRLGPYEEIIRLMLINGDPGIQNAFPCIIANMPKDVPGDVVSQPTRSKSNGTVYNYLINGFSFQYFISGTLFPDWGKEVVIKENGLLKIPQMSTELAKDLLNFSFGRIIFK